MIRKVFSLLDDMTPAQLRGLLVVGVVAGVIAAFSALGLSIYGASNAASAAHNAATVSRDIRTLLLDGKTASAKSAKVTANNTRLLLAQQEFDHTQTENGTKELRVVIREVEAHLDRTISRSVTRAAIKVAKEFKR